MVIFLFCSSCALRHLAAEGTLPPNLFCKGPTYGIMCAHMQQISSLPSQPMYNNCIKFHEFANSHSASVQVVGLKIASSHYPIPMDIVYQWMTDWQKSGSTRLMGGIHFHCQIGISPGRRVLNEQSWLAHERSRTSFLKGSQVTDRQQGEGGEMSSSVHDALHPYASQCITTRHSLVNALSSGQYSNTQH